MRMRGGLARKTVPRLATSAERLRTSLKALVSEGPRLSLEPLTSEREGPGQDLGAQPPPACQSSPWVCPDEEKLFPWVFSRVLFSLSF